MSFDEVPALLANSRRPSAYVQRRNRILSAMTTLSDVRNAKPARRAYFLLAGVAFLFLLESLLPVQLF